MGESNFQCRLTILQAKGDGGKQQPMLHARYLQDKGDADSQRPMMAK